MTSKERVVATLEGRIPDRVPYGEFCVDFDTVERILGRETYLRAKARSQIAFWERRHAEVVASWTADHIELHRRLPLDIVNFPMATWEVPPETDDPPPRRVDAFTWEDKYGRVYKMSEFTRDITCVVDPVRDARVFRPEDFAGPAAPPAVDPRSLRIVDDVIRAVGPDKFVCGPSGGEIGLTLLGGMERGLRELIDNPEAVRAATARRLAEQDLADDVLVHPASDGVLWGDDWGYKTGPLISPAMFRDFFLDANRERARRFRRFGKKVLKHCCGNVSSYLDFFLEIGFDAYQSIQPTAGMDLARLKRAVGDRMTLWGGVAVEHLMAGTPEEVRADVREAMRAGKPGGRFILGASHSIAVGTKYDNYMAMLDEYWKWCAYD